MVLEVVAFKELEAKYQIIIFSENKSLIYYAYQMEKLLAFIFLSLSSPFLTIY